VRICFEFDISFGTIPFSVSLKLSVTFLKGNEVAWGSTEYIVMRPKRGFHPFFAYVLARNSDFREYAEGCLAGSSGRQRID
jgi:type I restriction enzyme S subunit